MSNIGHRLVITREVVTRVAEELKQMKKKCQEIVSSLVLLMLARSPKDDQESEGERKCDKRKKPSLQKKNGQRSSVASTESATFCEKRSFTACRDVVLTSASPSFWPHSSAGEIPGIIGEKK
ncbi:hypothetical protein DMENIID0001_107070 [Sergentomyia squamirostris]